MANNLFTRLRPGEMFSAEQILFGASVRVSADPHYGQYMGDLICNFLHRAMDHIRLDSTTEDVWDIIESGEV